MATTSMADILRIAQQAVPEHIRPLGRVVGPLPPSAGVAALAKRARKAGAAADDTLIADLARHVGAKLAKPSADSAEVEFAEQTSLGLRTTVVHVRNGKVERIFKRG
jgi:predicted nucleic acid-binding protein